MGIRTAIAAAIGSLCLAGAVQATPVNTVSTDTSCGATSPSCDLQTLLNAWTTVGTAPNVNTGQYAPDERWVIGSTDRSSGILVFEVAGNASGNSFGIYDVLNASLRLELYTGAQSSGAKVTVDRTGNVFTNLDTSASQIFGSEVFGFYLTDPTGNTYFSESELNGTDVDHMVAFNGNNQTMSWPYDPTKTRFWLPNEILLAWEDLPDGDGDGRPGDWDYNDMLVIMESVRSVPVPAPLALLGGGLLALGLARRRS